MAHHPKPSHGISCFSEGFKGFGGSRRLSAALASPGLSNYHCCRQPAGFAEGAGIKSVAGLFSENSESSGFLSPNKMEEQNRGKSHGVQGRFCCYFHKAEI